MREAKCHPLCHSEHLLSEAGSSLFVLNFFCLFFQLNSDFSFEYIFSFEKSLNHSTNPSLFPLEWAYLGLATSKSAHPFNSKNYATILLRKQIYALSLLTCAAVNVYSLYYAHRKDHSLRTICLRHHHLLPFRTNLHLVMNAHCYELVRFRKQEHLLTSFQYQLALNSIFQSLVNHFLTLL